VLAAVIALTGLGYAVALVAVPVGALAALLILVPIFRSETPDSPCAMRHSPFLWLLVGTAMALSLFVEVIVLKGDVGRMNTVFKFHLQVWVLLAIAAAVSLANLSEKTRQRGDESREAAPSPTRPLADSLSRSIAFSLYRSLALLLILGGALFLPFGIRARAIDRMAPETGATLDGMAFMQHASIIDGPEGAMEEIALAGDYFAIRWMQEHIVGSPVIVEGLGRREYLWANRVSVYTGLPTVVGWRWHQVQQRAGLEGRIVDQRRSDVNTFYNVADVALAQDILERYGVRYVYVGAYERAYYDPAGLAKFDAMVEQDILRVVYNGYDVTVYEVVE
jgi:uncharacterized membrane protein